MLQTENDKSHSFMTNEDNAIYWITATNTFYKNSQVEVMWSFIKHQSKLSAQILQQPSGKKAKSSLTIAFYISTHRVLVQGNGCKEWYATSFPQIKQIMSESLKDGERLETDHIINSLCNKTEDSMIREEDEEEQCAKDIADDQHDAASQISTQINDENEPTTDQERKRNLPTPPSTPTSNNTVMRSYKLAIDKLINENAELKVKLHSVTVECELLRDESKHHTTQIEELKEQLLSMSKSINNNSETQNDLDIFYKKHKEDLMVLNDRMKAELRELFERTRHGQDKYEHLQANDDDIFDMIKAMQDNMDELKGKIKDLEEEMNNIQEDVFNRDESVETVAINKEAYSDARRDDPRDNTAHVERRNDRRTGDDTRTEKVFREPRKNKFNNDILIFGDSNTKGLNPKKLNANINSLSGATIDSALSLLSSSQETDDTIKGVVFHLGSNNLINDTTQSIQEKFDVLIESTKRKYPNVKIGICHIPNWKDMDNQKIQQINAFLKSGKAEFIPVSRYFQNDNKHYNQHGLAILAMNIKKWFTRNNLNGRKTELNARNVVNNTNKNNFSTPTLPAHAVRQNPWPMNWPMPGWYGNYPIINNPLLQFPRP